MTNRRTLAASNAGAAGVGAFAWCSREPAGWVVDGDEHQPARSLTCPPPVSRRARAELPSHRSPVRTDGVRGHLAPTGP